MGIDPQIGVKFCNFRKQKAVFLDHFVLEQPANQVRTFLLSLPSTRKRKKFQWKWKTCLFENATLPMGAPEVNLPELGTVLISSQCMLDIAVSSDIEESTVEFCCYASMRDVAAVTSRVCSLFRI